MGSPMAIRSREGGTSLHHDPGGAGVSTGTGSREGPAVQQPAPENESRKKSSCPSRESEAKQQRTKDLALETDPSVDISELTQKSEEFLSWCSKYARDAKGRSSQLARDLHDEKTKNDDLQIQILVLQEELKQVLKNLGDTETENENLRERVGQLHKSVISTGTPKSKGVDHVGISEGELEDSDQFRLLCQTVSETKSAIQDVKQFLMEHLPQPQPQPQQSSLATLANTPMSYIDWVNTRSSSKHPYKSARKNVDHDDPSRLEDFHNDPTNEEATKDVPSGHYTPEPVFVDLDLLQSTPDQKDDKLQNSEACFMVGKRPSVAYESGKRNIMPPSKRRKSSRFDLRSEISRSKVPKLPPRI